LILALLHLWWNCATAACTKARKTGSSQTALADPEDNKTFCSAISGQPRYGRESERLAGTPFDNSYSTMLGAAGADMKVQQELLRHSTIQSAMNIYTQAVSEQKRAANSMVVGILFNEIASKNQPPANGS
jgi:hypothetical protein